jgi:hypothetical protein
MPVLQGIRDHRRALLVAAAAVVLGAGGAGAAYATPDGGAPAETGYAVVDTATPGTSSAEKECDEPGGAAAPGAGSEARL